MNNEGGFPPRKGSGWIADQIAAAFVASRVRPAPADQRLSRPDADGLVAEVLEEELERLGEEKEPSPPAPLPRAGEG